MFGVASKLLDDITQIIFILGGLAKGCLQQNGAESHECVNKTEPKNSDYTIIKPVLELDNTNQPFVQLSPQKVELEVIPKQEINVEFKVRVSDILSDLGGEESF